LDLRSSVDAKLFDQQAQKRFRLCGSASVSASSSDRADRAASWHAQRRRAKRRRKRHRDRRPRRPPFSATRRRTAGQHLDGLAPFGGVESNEPCHSKLKR
jgi:hypothetical protein